MLPIKGDRRDFLTLAGAAALAPLAGRWGTTPTTGGGGTMYGLIGKINAVTDQRDALEAILLENTRPGAMPGCLSYVVATDSADPDALWVTEVWDSAASHQASLALPAVKAAITKA